MAYDYPRYKKASFQVSGNCGKEDCLYRNDTVCNLSKLKCTYYNNKRDFLYFWLCNNFISKNAPISTIKNYCKYSNRHIKNNKVHYSCSKLNNRCTRNPINCLSFINKFKP